MSHQVVMEQTYPFPPERVWRALTDRDAIAQWLMPNDFEPRVGHKFQFRTKPTPAWRGYVDCEVLEVVPGERLAYSWHGDAEWAEPTVVRWILTRTEAGTRLRLEHSNLQDPWGQALAAMLSQGWKKMIEEKLLRAIEALDSRG